MGILSVFHAYTWIYNNLVTITTESYLRKFVVNLPLTFKIKPSSTKPNSTKPNSNIETCHRVFKITLHRHLLIRSSTLTQGNKINFFLVAKANLTIFV